MEPAKLAKKWASGDYMYGAVDTYSQPGGLHYLQVGSREYPVARLSPIGNGEYAVDRWIPRFERFPEPISGFNKGNS